MADTMAYLAVPVAETRYQPPDQSPDSAGARRLRRAIGSAVIHQTHQQQLVVSQLLSTVSQRPAATTFCSTRSKRSTSTSSHTGSRAHGPIIATAFNLTVGANGDHVCTRSLCVHAPGSARSDLLQYIAQARRGCVRQGRICHRSRNSVRRPAGSPRRVQLHSPTCTPIFPAARSRGPSSIRRSARRISSPAALPVRVVRQDVARANAQRHVRGLRQSRHVERRVRRISNRVKPETVHDVEIGTNYRSRLLDVQANVYSMDFRNEIAPIGALDELGYELTGTSRRATGAGSRPTSPIVASVDGCSRATRPRASTDSRIYRFERAVPVTYHNVEPLLTPRFLSFARAQFAATR